MLTYCVDHLIQKIRNWFHNHSGPRRPGSTNEESRHVRQTIAKLIKVGGKRIARRTKMHAIHAYKELFWDTYLHDVIASEWEDLKDKPENKNRQLAYMNQRLREMLDQEDDDVKLRVEEYRRQKNVEIDREESEEEDLLLPGEESLPQEEQERRKDLRRRQRGIDFTLAVMQDVGESIREQTGLTVFMMAGGPEPGRGGRFCNLQ